MYTELFTEYLKTYEMPTLFSAVPDLTVGTEKINFSDTFELNFVDREIGFETEELFALKFESKAREVIPFYLDKLTELNKLAVKTSWTKSISGGGKDSHKRELKDTGTLTRDLKDAATTNGTRENVSNGEKKNYLYPDGASVTENALNSAESSTEKDTETIKNNTVVTDYTGSETNIVDYTGSETNEKTNNSTETFNLSPLEMQNLHESIIKDTWNLWAEIFKKFDNIFLAVM